MRESKAGKSGLTVEQFTAMLRHRLRGHIPGSRIPRRSELARHFGVSEYMVRQACRQLASEGLLNVRHRGGMVVKAIPAGPRIRRVLVLAQPRKIHLFQQAVLLGISQGCAFGRLPMKTMQLEQNPRDPDLIDQLVRDNPLETGWVLLNLLPSDAALLAWRARGVPLVVVDDYPQSVQANFVARDVQSAVYRATETVLLLGHRRVACVSLDTTRSRLNQLRVRGWRLAHQRHGVAVDEALVLMDTGQPGSTRERLAKVLSRDGNSRFTAIVGVDQRIGCEALSACNIAGLSVPGQMSVVSAGAHPHLEPENLARLSCYDEGLPERMGRMAMDLLLHPPEQSEPAGLLLGSNWIDRGSVAPPPA
ncbi:MAG: HTH-type transcriptional repressor PurR [Phycisphaerae bacterium]|nr:HTH-type transcriptional repressor PurR [Phycisphaerae bacterium]